MRARVLGGRQHVAAQDNPHTHLSCRQRSGCA
jgi:hypothetical protein